MHQNLVRRRLGLASVHVATAGRSTEEGSGSANDSVPVVGLAGAMVVVGVAMGERTLPAADRATVSVAVHRLTRRHAAFAALVMCWVPFAIGVRWSWMLVLGAVFGAWFGRHVGRARRHGIGEGPRW